MQILIAAYNIQGTAIQKEFFFADSLTNLKHFAPCVGTIVRAVAPLQELVDEI